MGPTDDYIKEFDAIFHKDSQFSKSIMKQVAQILHSLNLPKDIQDNCGTAEDFKGHDLTIKPLQIGVRVRRYGYVHYDEFTQDDKERDTMNCDLYFMGYAEQDEQSLHSYMVFNYSDFKMVRSTPACPRADRKQNYEHSLVWFDAWRNRDILDSCHVYDFRGTIGMNKRGLADKKIQAMRQFEMEFVL